jgi:hypothetical protein
MTADVAEVMKTKRSKIKDATSIDEDVVVSQESVSPPLIHDLAALNALVKKQEDRIQSLESYIAQNHSVLNRVTSLVINTELKR